MRLIETLALAMSEVVAEDATCVLVGSHEDRARFLMDMARAAVKAMPPRDEQPAVGHPLTMGDVRDIAARHEQDAVWFKPSGPHSPDGYVGMAHRDRGALLERLRQLRTGATTAQVKAA